MKIANFADIKEAMSLHVESRFGQAMSRNF
jgi:hypothetical protein